MSEPDYDDCPTECANHVEVDAHVSVDENGKTTVEFTTRQPNPPQIIRKATPEVVAAWEAKIRARMKPARGGP